MENVVRREFLHNYARIGPENDLRFETQQVEHSDSNTPHPLVKISVNTVPRH